MPNVLTILNAYINGTNGSITADGATVSFNFSGKNGANILGTVHGHTHNLINGKVGDNEIIRLGTPNGCYGRNNEYGSSAYGEDFRTKYGETTTYSKIANTAKDTAFVINVWDLEHKCVNSICYGAGYDRTLSWAGIKYYSIKNTLINVTTDNVAISVAEGSSYTATLSVANVYALKSVVVTMGGVDITETAVVNNTINISNVTGNIIITATATKPAVNLVPTALDLDLEGVYNNGRGYKNGVYVSSSSLADGSDNNCVATGLIEYAITETSAPTIYIKGITLDNTSHSRFVGVSADGQLVSCIADGVFFTNGRFFTITELDEQYYKLEPIVLSDGRLNLAVNGIGIAKLSQVKYMRLSFDNDVRDNLFIAYEPIDGSVDDSGNSGSGDTTTYTNQIPKSIATDGSIYNGKGYKENYRIPTSSGNESSASGMNLTGFIKLGTAPNVVRVKDIDLSNGNSTFGVYHDDFSKDTTGYCNSSFGATDANGVRSFTVSRTGGYIRISGAFGTNPIITVNEEIK
jgi:hypothetical protein